MELTDQFKLIFDSSEPHREKLPGHWSELSLFERLLVLRCIRPDKVTNAMQDFVTEEIGQRFIGKPILNNLPLSNLYQTILCC